MDLTALVTMCALGADPKVMHALIWHQSGGEPWSFSVPGEPNLRVYAVMQDAANEARGLYDSGLAVRIGLTGLTVDPSSSIEAIMMPCSNITIAAGQIAQLAERCKALERVQQDSTWCAVAAFRGSWERPDIKFADAVKASVVNGDAPDFEMPKETGLPADAVPSRPSRSTTAPTASSTKAENEDLASVWSSKLFPVKPVSDDTLRRTTPEHDQLGVRQHPTDTAKPESNGLFAPRSLPTGP